MTRSTADPAVKKSVSFPTSLLDKAKLRCRALGWNLSQYCQHLMREDLLRHSAITRVSEDVSVYHSKTVHQLERAAKQLVAEKKKTKKRQAKRKSA